MMVRVVMLRMCCIVVDGVRICIGFFVFSRIGLMVMLLLVVVFSRL